MKLYEVILGDHYSQMQIIVFANNEKEIMHKYIGVISIHEVTIH
jgi:hypothetical protein